MRIECGLRVDTAQECFVFFLCCFGEVLRTSSFSDNFVRGQAIKMTKYRNYTLLAKLFNKLAGPFCLEPNIMLCLCRVFVRSAFSENKYEM